MHYLSSKTQNLLIFALQNDGVIKSKQNIYTSRRFYDIIRFLKKNNIIIPVCWVCSKKLNDGQIDVCKNEDNLHEFFKNNRERRNNKKKFKLTLNGEILAIALKGLS